MDLVHTARLRTRDPESAKHTRSAASCAAKSRCWSTVRELEETFLKGSQEIYAEASAAFRESEWQSSRPHLANPRLQGFNNDRFWARNQDQEQIWESEAFSTADAQRKQLYLDLYEGLTEACMTEELQGRMPLWLPLAPYSKKALAHGSQPR